MSHQRPKRHTGTQSYNDRVLGVGVQQHRQMPQQILIRDVTQDCGRHRLAVDRDGVDFFRRPGNGHIDVDALSIVMKVLVELPLDHGLGVGVLQPVGPGIDQQRIPGRVEDNGL